MKFLKWMTVVLLPIALVACGESDIDKFERLKKEYQAIKGTAQNCRFAKSLKQKIDEKCEAAIKKEDDLRSQLEYLQNKIISK